ncbi:MAG TPA: hypothetical protein VH370_23105 [Humisphaera sp.]|jgi:hypothetical protein|nr:hypothetical protein [Humisphaera sp.]
MRDVFFDELPSQSPADDDPAAAYIRESLDGQFVCPFCGVVNSSSEGLCVRCSMENTPASRKATRLRIGPWYVYQHRNPAAPGMKFETLLAFVKNEKVKPRSIVRGPTTGQLWRFAAHVKGLSRHFGVCYSCGGSIDATANLCPHCNKLQEPPPNPDVLMEGSESQAPPKAAIVPPHPRPANPQQSAAKPVPVPQTPARPAAQPAARHTAIPQPAAKLKQKPKAMPAALAPLVKGPPGESREAFEDKLIASEDRGAIADEPRVGSAPVAHFRKQPISEDFLSARELATAFNLGFTGEAVAAGSPRHNGRRQKRRTRRRVLALLLIAAILASFASPVVRQNTAQWGTLAWTKAQPLIAKLTTSTPKPAAPIATGDKPPVKIVAVVQQPSPAIEKPTKTPDVQPVKATQPDSPPLVAKAPASHNEPLATTEPSPATVPAAQPPEHVVAAAPPDKDASEKARSLYSQAIDAEQRVDFSTAIACYEQIKKLPRDVWQTDLDVRLGIARKLAELK